MNAEDILRERVEREASERIGHKVAEAMVKDAAARAENYEKLRERLGPDAVDLPTGPAVEEF